MAPTPVRILSKPGIKRDGTMLEGDFYVDGKWVRWQRGLPRKMLGYRQISSSLAGPVREVNADNANGQTIIHCFSQSGIERIAIDNLSGVSTGVIDRTPAGYSANAANDNSSPGVAPIAAACSCPMAPYPSRPTRIGAAASAGRVMRCSSR